MISCGRHSSKGMAIDPSQHGEATGRIANNVNCPNERGDQTGDAMDQSVESMDTTEVGESAFTSISGEASPEIHSGRNNCTSHEGIALGRTSTGVLKLGPYILQKKLGKGAQGVVYLSHNKDAGTNHAVKLVRLPSLDSERGRKRRDRQIMHIKSEAKALQVAAHPNILALNDFVLQAKYPDPLKSSKSGGGKAQNFSAHNKVAGTDSTSGGGASSVSTVKLSHHQNEERVELEDTVEDTDISVESLSLAKEADEFFAPGEDLSAFVMDLAPNGELMLVLIHTGALPEDVARAYFAQLGSAIATCHSIGVYHRDLKPENILLDAKYQIKLADFGLAKLRDEEIWNGEKFCSTVCGTRGYMAPEVLNGKRYDPAKADAWSLGVLLFIMVSGNPPVRFAHTNDWWFRAIYCNRFDRFWQAHERLKPGVFNDASKDLLTALLDANPDKRVPVAIALQHRWLTQSPLLSSRDVEEIMKAIKTKADMAEAVEVAKSLEHKRAEVSSKNQGRNFDPFVAKHKRSVGSGGGKESGPHPKPPASKSLVPPFAQFYMLDVSLLSESSQACAALEQVVASCRLAGASRVEANARDFMVHVESSCDPVEFEEQAFVDDLDVEPTSVPTVDDVFLGEENITLELHLYQSAIEDTKVLLLEVQKLSGGTAAALGFVQRLKHKLGNAVLSNTGDELGNSITYKQPESLPKSLLLSEMLVV